jgi:hypothetical protein
VGVLPRQTENRAQRAQYQSGIEEAGMDDCRDLWGEG